MRLGWCAVVAWPGPNAKTAAIWPAAHDLRNDRNLIAHGVWVVDDDARPIVVWHRKFLESEEYITGEYLDYRRFASFQGARAAFAHDICRI